MTKNIADSVNVFDEIVVWNTEQDAYEAVISYCCKECGERMDFSIEKDGFGEVFTANEDQLQSYIDNLEQKYHATARSVEKSCSSNHTQKLVYIFGETQPARYVLCKVTVAI